MNNQLLSVLSNLYVKVDKRPRLTIVTFHRVEGDSAIKREHIKHHLTFLARNYKVILPSQLSLSNNKESIAMVTIDDCHRDTYEHIFPIAKSLNIPITICVPTDFFFRKRWLWFDKLYWILEQAPTGTEVDLGGQILSISNDKSLANFKRLLKSKDAHERDKIITSLSDKLNCVTPATPTEEYRPVELDEMQEMLSTTLAEICAHSIAHPIMTNLSDIDLQSELRLSKEELEDFCKKEIVSFCYPNGGYDDFDDRTTNAVRSAGYKMALTSIEGTSLVDKIDLFTLKRVHAHQRKGVFEKLASGLGELQHMK